MKKTYRLEELDCANCAAKMERKIKKLKGVEDVEISFMAQKITIEAADDIFDEVVAETAKLISKVEPDCRLIIK